ncbi:hypothetical protein Bbelb_082470 [Branchiostoma belcheri]|nr:hypothetical protein Bbelb_082470 [Branchiostoma belcheri]
MQEEKAAEILAKALVKKGKGPLTSKLEPVLREYHVKPQAYHSRSFIGNHVNKMLQARGVARKHNRFLKQFAACHRRYSHAKPMGPKEIDELDDNQNEVCTVMYFMFTA